MTNEELVLLIQKGERDRISELWEQIKRFVYKWAGIYANKLERYGVTEEDLSQAGFLALMEAVETYDPEGELSFVGWMSYFLKKAFAEAAGYRSRKQSLDPLHSALALDAPLPGTEEFTLSECVADPTEMAETVEETVYIYQLQAALRKALNRLQPEMKEVVIRHYFDGQTFAQIAAETGAFPGTVAAREQRAFRKLRHNRELLSFLDSETDYYLHVGSNRFNTTHTSAVEENVFRRERLERQFEKKQEPRDH